MKVAVSVTHPATVSFLALLLGTLLVCPVLGQEEGECAADGTCSASDKSPPLACNTYMAPSTLGDSTNMGMYTGVDLEDGDVVNWPEIAIPLLFREWGDHPEGYTDGQLWERYVWEGSVVDIETYDETDTEKSKGTFLACRSYHA